MPLPQIYGFIGRMVIDRTDADEVLQETNIALWSESAAPSGSLRQAEACPTYRQRRRATST